MHRGVYRGTPGENRRTQRHHTRLVVFFSLFFRRGRGGRGCFSGRGYFGRVALRRLDDGGGHGSRHGRRHGTRPLRRRRLRRRFFIVIVASVIVASVTLGSVIVNRNASAVRVGERPRRIRLTLIVTAQLIGLIFVDRTGVGDFFGNAEFVQFVDDLARLHFQLPRQLIDANLTHNEAFRLTACYHADKAHKPPAAFREPVARPILSWNDSPRPHPPMLPPVHSCYHQKRIPDPIPRLHQHLRRFPQPGPALPRTPARRID